MIVVVGGTAGIMLAFLSDILGNTRTRAIVGGNTVVVVGREEAKMNAAVRELDASNDVGAKLKFVRCDLARAEDLAKGTAQIVKLAKESGEGVDYLFLHAGTGYKSGGDARALLNTNVIALLYILTSLVPYFNGNVAVKASNGGSAIAGHARKPSSGVKGGTEKMNYQQALTSSSSSSSSSNAKRKTQVVFTVGTTYVLNESTTREVLNKTVTYFSSSPPANQAAKKANPNSTGTMLDEEWARGTTYALSKLYLMTCAVEFARRHASEAEVVLFDPVGVRTDFHHPNLPPEAFPHTVKQTSEALIAHVLGIGSIASPDVQVTNGVSGVRVIRLVGKIPSAVNRTESCLPNGKSAGGGIVVPCREARGGGGGEGGDKTTTPATTTTTVTLEMDVQRRLYDALVSYAATGMGNGGATQTPETSNQNQPPVEGAGNNPTTSRLDDEKRSSSTSSKTAKPATGPTNGGLCNVS